MPKLRGKRERRREERREEGEEERPKKETRSAFFFVTNDGLFIVSFVVIPPAHYICLHVKGPRGNN